MQQYYKKTRFYPKKPIRSFRDLEVYQRTFNLSVEIMKKIIPEIEDKESPLRDQIIDSSLLIPNLIAEACSRRFDDKEEAFKLMEEAMAKCNNITVYLEQARDIFSDKLDKTLIEELIKNYMQTRTKMLNLLKAWKKFQREDEKK